VGDYALALLQGDRLSAQRRAEVCARLSSYTGLSEGYLERADLRVDIMRFVRELLRDEGLTVGRLDSRFTGGERDAVGETFSYDPSYATIQGPYTATLNDYVRRELGFESDLSYEIIASLYKTWSYNDFENRYAEVGETLRSAMTQNPFLRVHVASGYFDLATPYFATEYTLAHLGLTPEQRGRLSVSYYEAGHMMYVQRAALAKLKAELTAFVRA
jgi:carboxypeptidase C (cathepsin A)